LAAEEGQPAETLMNVVALIAKALSKRTFVLRICSNRIEPIWCWPQPWAFGGSASAVCEWAIRRRAGGAWWRNRCVLSPWEQGSQSPPALQILRREAGEDAYPVVPGEFRLSTGEFCRVFLVVQTIEPRVFSEDEILMLAQAAAPSRASSERGADAGSLQSLRAQERLGPLARNLVVEFGEP